MPGMFKNQKKNLKFALYQIFLNSDQGAMTPTEHDLFYHLSVDDEVGAALTQRAKRDYAAMNRKAKKVLTQA